MLVFAGLVLASVSIGADESLDGRDHPFQDSLLEKLVGDWHVECKFGSGRTAENSVRAEWVLDHQFLLLHYRDVASPPKYEAMVFIGYDNSEQSFVCHWIDVYGGRYSALGRGKIDNDKRAIEFRFDAKDGALTNTFTFDSETSTWTSLIRQQEKGEWKLFAEEKFTRAETKQ